MTFDLRTADLRRLNSLTKYPSIPTYHTLDPKNGRLLAEVVPFAGKVLATEKVDGTNTRIVFTPDGEYLIGSREEFLHARGDLVGDRALGIVEAMRQTAERVRDAVCDRGAVVVLFGELFGGKITAASKQYTSTRRVGFRLFDVLRVEDHAALLSRSPETISAWREAGEQRFVDEAGLADVSLRCDLPLTPRVAEWDAADLPRGLDEALAFLLYVIPVTRCDLDDGAGRRSEGLVIRTADRRRIAKLRFEDYERTLRAAPGERGRPA